MTDFIANKILEHGLYPAAVVLNEFIRDESYEACIVMREAIISACNDFDVDPQLVFRPDAVEYLYNVFKEQIGEKEVLRLNDDVVAFKVDIFENIEE